LLTVLVVFVNCINVCCLGGSLFVFNGEQTYLSCVICANIL